MDKALDSFIFNKTLVFTVTSDGYKDYTWNLWTCLQKLNLSWKLCILCLDKESLTFLERIAGIHVVPFFMEGPHLEHKTPAIFGTTPFKRMNRMKLQALEQLSQRTDIDTLLFLDSDIVVFSDPLVSLAEPLASHPLWFQCDEGNKSNLICTDINACGNACTGVIAMKLTETTRAHFKELFAIVSETWRAATTDQDYIHVRLKALALPHKTLPRTIFPNGIFLRGDKYKELNPVLLHFNYLVGNTKKQTMKRKGYWYLDV